VSGKITWCAGRASVSLVLLAVLFAVGLLSAPVAHATVTCSFADGVLRIGTETDLDESVVVRSGSEIQVLGGKVFAREPKPVDCAGLTPTVSNTDTVLLDEAPNVDEGGAEIDLSGGRFAPGKTPEADGSGEIEITVRLNGDDGYAEVVGGPARDALQLQQQEPGTVVNLNAGSEAQGDFDLTLKDAEYQDVHGGGGADRLSLLPGGSIPEFLSYFSSLSIDGGNGGDVLVDGRGSSFTSGGGGRDAIHAGGGFDFVAGGPGRDRLRAGGGRDYVFSEDRSADRVGCGGSKDRAFADRHDHLRSCEKRHSGGGGGGSQVVIGTSVPAP
jgi:Ca2+-binding RTX toxin-like protein